jgi:hypothetical protein
MLTAPAAGATGRGGWAFITLIIPPPDPVVILHKLQFLMAVKASRKAVKGQVKRRANNKITYVRSPGGGDTDSSGSMSVGEVTCSGCSLVTATVLTRPLASRPIERLLVAASPQG